MFTKYIVPAVLSGFLMLSTSVFAQHRGAAPAVHHSAPAVQHSAVHHNPTVVQHPHGNVAAYNHGYHYGNYGQYNHGYYGGRYYGGYWPGYYSGGWPYYAGYTPYYGYGYNYANTYPDYTYYTPPVVPAVVPQQTLQAGYIRVLVPDPYARVWFNGWLTQQAGTDRMFNTPLISNAVTYQIRAAWMNGANEMTGERTVTVAPGATAVVDFTSTY